MKALKRKAGDIRIKVNLHYVLFGEHVDASNSNPFSFSSITRKILGDVEREAQKSLRAACLAAGIREDVVNAFLLPELRKEADRG